MGWRCGFNHHQQRADRRDNHWPKRDRSDVPLCYRKQLERYGRSTGSPSGKHSGSYRRRSDNQSGSSFKLQSIRFALGFGGPEQRRNLGHRHDRPDRGERLRKWRLHRHRGDRFRGHLVGHSACLRDCSVGSSPSRRRWSDDSANGAAGDDAHQYGSDRWSNV